MKPALAEYVPLVKREEPPEKKKRDRMRDFAIGTNVVGGVAGPAALYGAVRSARNNEGGIPRDVARGVTGTRAGQTRAGQRVKRAVNTLDNKVGRRGKIGAGVAGAGLVGLQTVNWGGDMLSAKLLADQKKQGTQSVQKGSGMLNDVYESEGRGDGRGHSLQSIAKRSAPTAAQMLGTELADEEIAKRARRYDPEADRQRRMGLYSGLGIGGSALAGRAAADRLAGSVDRKKRTVTIPRMSLKGLSGDELKRAKRGRAGLGLAAVSALSGGGGVAAYRHGVSRRNQPYN